MRIFTFVISGGNGNFYSIYYYYYYYLFALKLDLKILHGQFTSVSIIPLEICMLNT